MPKKMTVFKFTKRHVGLPMTGAIIAPSVKELRNGFLNKFTKNAQSVSLDPNPPLPTWLKGLTSHRISELNTLSCKQGETHAITFKNNQAKVYLENRDLK